MGFLSVLGSVLGGLLGGGNSDDGNDSKITIAMLQQQIDALKSSLKTYKTLTYVFGLGFIVALFFTLRKK